MADQRRAVKGGPIVVRSLFIDESPTDPVEVFRQLVADRRVDNVRRLKAHTAALKALGWSVLAIEPRRPGGDS